MGMISLLSLPLKDLFDQICKIWNAVSFGILIYIYLAFPSTFYNVFFQLIGVSPTGLTC